MNDILIAEYDYALPHEKIAEWPLSSRNESKLLIYRDGKITDSRFYHLADYIDKGATLVINDTRVIEARLLFQKATGGIIEVFCLEPQYPSEVASAMSARSPVRWRGLIGGASKWKPGQVLEKNLEIEQRPVKLSARYISKETEDFIIEFSWDGDFAFSEVLHAAGAIPLPPYIKRNVKPEDAERYQTVFADQPGSVAAPTAALHFTQKEFASLDEKGVRVEHITLHVGAGTFKPVKTETISAHQMHAEHFHVSTATLRTLSLSPYLIAVGTTSLRTLETLYWLGVKAKQQLLSELSFGQWEAYELHSDLTFTESLEALIKFAGENSLDVLNCRTSLLIRPGYKIRSAKALITNFHQPRSTLLLLVAAFIGDDWKRIYQHALDNDYRFLSYGDSSILFRND